MYRIEKDGGGCLFGFLAEGACSRVRYDLEGGLCLRVVSFFISDFLGIGTRRLEPELEFSIELLSENQMFRWLAKSGLCHSPLSILRHGAASIKISLETRASDFHSIVLERAAVFKALSRN